MLLMLLLLLLFLFLLADVGVAAVAVCVSVCVCVFGSCICKSIVCSFYIIWDLYFSLSRSRSFGSRMHVCLMLPTAVSVLADVAARA